jgi:hypothetical protein
MMPCKGDILRFESEQDESLSVTVLVLSEADKETISERVYWTFRALPLDNPRMSVVELWGSYDDEDSWRKLA